MSTKSLTLLYFLTLLLGPYFTPVELAALGQSLDDEEQLRMAEGDINSEEYRRFLQQPSSNYDDSGFFSIQVKYYDMYLCILNIMVKAMVEAV